MDTARALTVATALLAAIRERDRAGVAACFAPDARLRVLTPRSLREEEGPDAIGARFMGWVASLESFALLSADAEVVADRVRIRYRFHGRDPEKGWQENEHTGYATIDDGRITTLNVSCAGFRPAEPR